ncbi:hypothetical protein PHYPSEUDO_000106 [Phytophthora pseudosyringae]|uniref:phosphoribosylaminoimidazole carboxylase n=1 Tax=Phytophthora pseudosyringae TaxID=221518 RepID=A0A8T1WQD0_9STRA|nr:hypothetical protein PHYPSEUDO_000106 [Phytophthora pseudosyringae]
MKLVGVLRSRRHALLRAAAAAKGGERVAPKYRAAGLSTSSNEDKNSVLELLQKVADGKVSPQVAAELCGPAAEYEAVGDFAKIDTKREARTGFPEVVYAESKTPEQVAAIMKAMIHGGEDNVMASRVTPQAADEIRAFMPGQHLTYYEVPRILASKSLESATKSKEEESGDEEKEASTACVLCAGTSDLPVAEEAAVTLELADYRVTRLYDVGVAGIHRLLRNQHILRASDVAICVAGMDGALPGVVGGLTSAPVIAVPTSVGYGAAFGGLAPLLTMLNACSPGVGVVNIDNGFGAAVLADKLLRSKSRTPMGRKKAPVTRNKSVDRHPPAAGSSSPASSLLGDVSPSSLRGLAAIKHEPTAMDTESSSDSLQLPSPRFQSLHTALPIGGETRPTNRRKRRSSGDDAAARRRDEADASSDEESQGEEQEQQEEMVTISVAELEKWQQRVIFHVEDHFANEQLKRIAEFGRVHGTIMQEARQYVSNMEVQLRSQLEEERASLRAQAEEFVAKTAAENESLRQQVEGLGQQVEGLEKQVDTLEQEVDALEVEKAQDTRQLDEERRGNREEPQETYSPPNNHIQVQPGNCKMNENAKNHPANNSHEANGYEIGAQGNLHSSLSPKHTGGGGLTDHGCASKPTDAVPPHDFVGRERDQLKQQQQQQQPQSNIPPANGTQSSPGGVAHDGLPATKSSESPADAGELRSAGGTC